MQFLDTVVAWITSHSGLTATIATILWEVLGRLAPTEKRASLFSWTGKFLHSLGQFCFVISDALGKVIPDNRKK